MLPRRPGAVRGAGIPKALARAVVGSGPQGRAEVDAVAFWGFLVPSWWY